MSGEPHHRRDVLCLLGAAGFLAAGGCRVRGEESDEDAPVSTAPDSGSAGSDAAAQPGAGVAMPAFGLVGTVSDASGAPLGALLVEAAPADAATPPVPELAIFTDAQGRYYWPLRAGFYRVRVDHAGRSAEARVRVPQDAVARLDLTLR